MNVIGKTDIPNKCGQVEGYQAWADSIAGGTDQHSVKEMMIVLTKVQNSFVAKYRS